MTRVLLREKIPPTDVRVGGNVGGTALQGRPFWIYGRGSTGQRRVWV